MVGELTYRATRGVIEYEELEPVSVKGKEEALPVWRAIEARSRFGVDVEQRTQVPLIGRDHELNLLRELFGRVTRDETVQLVTVVGEPGVGKSRLVWEFQRVVDDLPDLVYWRQGRCLPYGEGITFWALAEVVKSHAGILENDSPEDAAAKLELAVTSLVEVPSERDWIRTRLEPLVGLGEQTQTTEREESFTAWRAFLEAIASTRPLVIVIEDLHWADPAMLAFVEHVADWASGVPLFVLCTARPELYERDPAWGGGTRNHTAVSLSPLSSEETAQLIAALLDRAVLPAETQTALLGRAGGNPLYAEEFIRMLVDRGILARRGASWDLTSGDEEIPVPETVQALIAARLDTLTPQRKALLQDAAVIGKVFWAGALAEMGGIDARDVRDGLHELSRKELLRPARRSSVNGETEYAFWHLLVRDVAYGQIPRAARAEKHRAAATWIEKIAGERAADSAELLAYHYEQALELVRAAGGSTGELEGQALRFLMLAAERAFRLDTGKALALFRRALPLTRPGDPERIRVLMLGGRLTLSGYEGAASEDLLVQAIDEARSTGNVPGEAEALAWRSRVAWVRGDTARQVEMIEEAARLLEGRPPSRELAIVLARRVASHGMAGRTAEILETSEEALPVIRAAGSEMDLAIVLQMRGQARVDTGDVEGGFEDLREGLRIALESSPAQFVSAAHVNLGDNVWFAGDPVGGQELYEAGAEIGERRGASGGAEWARMETMWTRYDLGRWDELLEVGQGVLDRELERGGQVGATQLSVLADIYRRDVLLHRGTSGDDDEVEASRLPRAREIGDGQVLVPVFRVAALARMDRGGPEGAVALLVEIDELLRGRPGFRSWLLDWGSRVCLASGDPDLLRSLVEQGIAHLARDQGSVASGRAVLAEIEGDHASALERYEDAAARWEAFPSVLERGRALAGAGRCLLELGRHHDAAERLRGARSAYASLGAAPLVAETDEMLARATAKIS